LTLTSHFASRRSLPQLLSTSTRLISISELELPFQITHP
jgi:hypothetical protein